jgi:hypothetical protein
MDWRQLLPLSIPQKIKALQFNNIQGFSWCGAGSNRRHKDFQSFALPTELPHHQVKNLKNQISSSNRAANIGSFRKNPKTKADKIDFEIGRPRPVFGACFL